MVISIDPNICEGKATVCMSVFVLKLLGAGCTASDVVREYLFWNSRTSTNARHYAGAHPHSAGLNTIR